MKFSLKHLRFEKVSLSNIYVISLVVTMVFLLMRKNSVLMQTSLFSEASLKEIQIRLSGESPTFLFVLQQRLVIFFSLFVLSTTILGSLYVYMNVLWYGISSGLFFAIVLMRYGVKGLLLLVAGMFPHYLIYVPALILVFHLSREKRTVNSKYILQLLIVSSVVIIGCVLECYVNPEVVAKILKKF